jgi:putative alpha-1,2-mannosidase
MEKTRMLNIIAKDAPSKPYIKSMTINGKNIDLPIVRHEDIANGGEIVFEMSDKVENWGNELLVSLIHFCLLSSMY